MPSAFTLVTEAGRPVAVIVDSFATPEQLSTLYKLLPESATLAPILTDRWACGPVLCEYEWRQAQLRRKPMLKPKGHRMALLSLLLSAFQLFSVSAFPASLPSFPSVKSVQSVAQKVTNTWYFAATAVDTNGLESEYSTEVLLHSTTNLQTATLAWDPSRSNGQSRITYQVYTGPAPRTYTNTTSAGTNLTVTVWLAPAPRTNLLCTLQPMVATNATGPWFAISNWPAIRLTNPPGNGFYRVNVLRTNI